MGQRTNLNTSLLNSFFEWAYLALVYRKFKAMAF
jgi:hypothetical protein